MRSKLGANVYSLVITSLLLIFLEIFSSAFLPAIGFEKYRLPFNILIILYMALKLDIPYLAIFIIFIQMLHGAFSVEGWAIGTIAGVLIAISIGYLKELLHLSSAIMTMLVMQIFQVIWFVIVSTIFYLRTANWDVIGERFSKFVPESIVISLLAPIFFSLLDKIWKGRESSSLGAEL